MNNQRIKNNQKEFQNLNKKDLKLKNDNFFCIID